jgi:hypothetical protein
VGVRLYKSRFAVIFDDGQGDNSLMPFYALREDAVAALPSVTAPARPRATRSRANRRRELPRLSIVVLPFANLSNDPDQQYFADGITEDVTTDLSRIAHSFVISRNTAFTYRNKPATRSRSAANWACVMCWKGACSGRVTGSE